MAMRWRTIGTILVFGTLWGACEVLGNVGLRALDVPRTSVFLTVASVLLLGLAAARLRAFGTLLLVALVAGAYRTITAGPFWCHVLAILALGFVFDALRTVLAPAAGRPLRTALLGFLAAFASHAAFGLLITYAFRYRHWTGDGGARLRDYLLVSGSIAAVACAVLLPPALAVDAHVRRRARAAAPGRRRWLPATAWAGVAALLWAAGLILP